MYKYLLPLLLLASCTTARKVEKWADRHPVKMAKIVLKKFPIIDSVIVRDSVVFDTASIAVDPYIPDFIDVAKDYSPSVDTAALRRLIMSHVKCPVQKTITITRTRDSVIYRENTAKVVVLEGALDNAQSEITAKNRDIEKLQGEVKKWHGKIKTKNHFIWWLLLLAIGEGAWIFRKPLLFLLNPIKRFYPF